MKISKLLTFVVSLAIAAAGLSAARTAQAEFVEPTVRDSSLIAAPTVVLSVKTPENAQNIATSGADSAIFTVGEDMAVLGETGEKIADFADIYGSIDGKVIPNIIAGSNALSSIERFAADEGMTDITMIGDEQFLTKVHELFPTARRMLDLREGDASFRNALFSANRAGANGVILPVGTDAETVRSLQNMMKAVWLDVGEGDRFEVMRALATGAFGIVTESPATARDVFAELGQGGRLLLRSPIIGAHRGDPYYYNENSIEGCEAAAKAGATHVELDFHLTADGEIVVMHDDTIDRTTNGKGAVSSMTYEQLARYNIIKNCSGTPTGKLSKIPTADDVFAFMQANPNVNLLLEIKANSEALITKLKEKIDEYSMADRIVFISFFEQQIIRARAAMPEIWGLYLGTSPSSVFMSNSIDQCARNGMGYDAVCNGVSDEFIKGSIDRGYLPAFWTYDTYVQETEALRMGVFAITCNRPTELSELYTRIECADLTGEPSDYTVGTEVEIELITVDGYRTPGVGTVVAVSETETGLSIAVTAEIAADMQALTVAEIQKPASGGTHGTGSGGCSGSVGGSCAALIFLAAAAFCKRPFGKVR